MNKLLVIAGPTATGKTSLALALAKQLNGEVVSADSRQVYQGMDIGTGKDLPKDPKFIIPSSKIGEKGIGYYEIKGIKLWGYDLVSPTEDFSVAHYCRIASLIIRQIWERKKLPIIVGGTGLYIRSIVDGIPTAEIPLNRTLRKELEKRGPDELYEKLATLDPLKAASLNASDRKNPRRLVRAIEIAQWNITKGKKAKTGSCGLENEIGSVLFIGLKTDAKKMEKRISRRVEERVASGIESEIRNLLNKGVDWNRQSMNTLGYKQWREFFQGKNKKEEVVDQWKIAERQYAKRQLTWFNKDKRIVWFDADDERCVKRVEKQVQKWYKIEKNKSPYAEKN